MWIQLFLHFKYIPEGPAYFDGDDLSDRNTRFFVTEIIREKLLLQFGKRSSLFM